MPLPAQPGQAERYDCEYRRNGTCNPCMFFETDRGWRHVAVTARRTLVESSQQTKWVVDEAYPQAEVVRFVFDNLNTHLPASPHEAFEPAEACRILKRLEFQCSWQTQH